MLRILAARSRSLPVGWRDQDPSYPRCTQGAPSSCQPGAVAFPYLFVDATYVRPGDVAPPPDGIPVRPGWSWFQRPSR